MTDYVLIADDDRDMVVLVGDILEDLGVEGREALDGQTALEMARAETPAAIVLDLRMPVVDGFAFLEEMEDDPALCDVPVIVMSAYVDAHEQAIMEHPCVLDVVSKGRPRVDELRALLLRALGREG